MHDDFCNMPGVLSLICSYTLCGDAVETHWSRRARCVHAVDAKWQLFARHEHTISALWPRSQSPVRTPWERGGTPWALLGDATVAVGAPWHLGVMENVKLCTMFCSIFVRSHSALRKIIAIGTSHINVYFSRWWSGNLVWIIFGMHTPWGNSVKSITGMPV